MENVFAGMQVCGHVGEAAAAAAGVCVFYVDCWVTVPYSCSLCPGLVLQKYSFLDMFFFYFLKKFLIIGD